MATGCDSSGKCSTLSLVSSSFEGVRVTSGVVDSSSSLSGINLDVSSSAIGGSSTTSSAQGGIGNSSASTADSCATSWAGVSAGVEAGSSRGGAGFTTGFGGAGAGLDANMLAHVFFVGAAAAACFGPSGSAAAGSLALAGPSSFASAEAAGISHAGDSTVGTEGAPRVPFVAPPRPPRNPPRPRSAPRPRPRALSPPRAPRPPRTVDVPSVGALASFTLERDRSFAFLTSANWETLPGPKVSRAQWRQANASNNVGNESCVEACKGAHPR